MRKIIQIKKRSPEEIAAYKEGFEAAVMMCVAAIETNVKNTDGATDSFHDGMMYSIKAIQDNADAFRRLVLNDIQKP